MPKVVDNGQMHEEQVGAAPTHDGENVQQNVASSSTWMVSRSCPRMEKCEKCDDCKRNLSNDKGWHVVIDSEIKVWVGSGTWA